MSVEYINPYHRPRRYLSQTPLNGAVIWSPGGWEGQPVGTWLPRQGLWFPNTFFHPLPSHSVSIDGLTATRSPSPPRTLFTITEHAASPARNPLLLPSIAHTPPLTEFPSPSKVCRPFRLSSRIFLQSHPVEQP